MLKDLYKWQTVWTSSHSGHFIEISCAMLWQAVTCCNHWNRKSSDHKLLCRLRSCAATFHRGHNLSGLATWLAAWVGTNRNQIQLSKQFKTYQNNSKHPYHGYQWFAIVCLSWYQLPLLEPNSFQKHPKTSTCTGWALSAVVACEESCGFIT